MESKILIREYKEQDKAQVLSVLRLNTPKYFSTEEEKDLDNYLEHEREEYFVLEVKREIVGSGGINFADNKTIGKLSWDFLHPDFQGQGLGTLLLQHRINILKNNKDIKRIMVRTSQLAYKFYEKSGFTLKEQAKDYWAKGFDLYSMEYTKK